MMKMLLEPKGGVIGVQVNWLGGKVIEIYLFRPWNCVLETGQRFTTVKTRSAKVAVRMLVELGSQGIPIEHYMLIGK